MLNIISNRQEYRPRKQGLRSKRLGTVISQHDGTPQHLQEPLSITSPFQVDL